MRRSSCAEPDGDGRRGGGAEDEVLARLRAELPGKRFLVSEIGFGGDDDDTARSAYLLAALEVHSCGRGMDITGVHFWTGVDNYEWLEGPSVPFGLFDSSRAPRPRARVVQPFIRSFIRS